jgi:hypothetical protein
MSALHTIKVKKYLDIISEYTANAAITPGNMVELMSTGKIRKHSTSGGKAGHCFALEDELQGKSIDTAYAAGDVVQCWWAVPGEEVYALVEDGGNYAVGDFLESNGAGVLTKSQDDSAKDPGAPSHIVGIAMDALRLDLAEGSESSAKGTYYPRIRVKII